MAQAKSEVQTATDGAAYYKSESTCVLVNGDDSTKMPRSKVTCYLVLATIVCFAGSSLQFGYNLSVINAPQSVIEDFFKNVKDFKSFLWPFAVAVFAVGGMGGAFIGPFIAKSIGRKRTLMLNNALAISGGIFLGVTKLANSVAVLIIGRILVGINAGINTVVAPMYLSEIAPVNLRGSLGTLNQFGIVSGLLLGNVLGLEEILGNESGWPYLFAMTAIIGALQLCLLPFCPESPRYLVAIKKDEEQAIENLKKLRDSDVMEEIAEIKLEVEREAAQQMVSVLELFKNSSYQKPLLISVVLQLAQQLSGIGGILYYSTELFKDIGLSLTESQKASCGVGALSVVMTLVCVFLVEIKGRRYLMLFGLGGMTILYAFCTVAFRYVEDDKEWAKYMGVVCTLASVVFFQLGPGAIPWFIVAELFTQNSLSAAVSIAGPMNWLGNFIVGLLFPLIKDGIHPYTFIPFLVLLVIFFLFTYFVVPETKGLTIAQINRQLRGYGTPDETTGEHNKQDDN